MVIPKAEFGRTGHKSTRVIFGAASLGNVSQKVADQTLEVLLRHGVNHIDTAASYGESELRIAPWLKREPGRFFVATKVDKRDEKGARAQLQRSLDRLGVDHVDLWQMHSLADPIEWDQALSPGGALDAALTAREEGLIKWIGVTGHGTQIAATHRRSLDRFDFDSVLLPYNFITMQNAYYRENFDALAGACVEKNVAVQTIKSIALRPWMQREHTRTTWVSASRVAGRHRSRRLVGAGQARSVLEQRRRRRFAAARPRLGEPFPSAAHRSGDECARRALSRRAVVRLGAFCHAVASRRTPGLDEESVSGSVEPRNDDLLDLDPKCVRVTLRRHLHRLAADLGLAAPRPTFRRVMRRTMDGHASISPQVHGFYRAGDRTDLELIACELDLRAADPRRPVAAQSCHREVLAGRHELADPRGELGLRCLELSPRGHPKKVRPGVAAADRRVAGRATGAAG